MSGTTFFQKIKNTRPAEFVLLLISIALLFYTIIRAVKIEFTMDEIWSWRYSLHGPHLYPAIYDQTSANDHWLNSWLMQLSGFLFGLHEWAFRLPNIIAHAVFLFFTARFVLNFRNSLFAIAAFILLNAHPYMLDFFSAARGYGLALACIAAAVFFLVRFVSENSSTKDLFYLLLAAALALLANFAVISFVLVCVAFVILTILRRKDKARNKQLLLIAAVILPLLLLVVPHLLRMQRSGALYYGEKTFWTGTVRTVINKLLYEDTYSGQDPFRYFQPALIALIGLIFSGAVISIRRKGLDGWMRSPSGIIFILLTGVILIIFLQHFIFGTLYPIQRVALFIFLLFIYSLLTTLNEMFEGRTLALTGVVPALAVLFYMIHFGNTGSLSEWEYSAGTQTAVNDISALQQKIKDGKSITICAQGGAGSTMEFIKEKDSLSWMNVSINWQADQPSRYDFYLVDKWALPSFNESQWIPMDTLPYSGNVLYMDSTFAKRIIQR
jgi:hypothetical protein